MLLPLIPHPDFVAAHPCEVWDKDGNYHSRYQTMICAARTVVDGIRGGYVIDKTPGAWDPYWDFARCLKEVNARAWVDYSSAETYAYRIPR